MDMKHSRKPGHVQAGTAPSPKLKPTAELNWAFIHKDLTEYFNSNENATSGRAKTALACLVAAGCRQRIVLQNLYLFCGGNPEEMQAVRTSLDYNGRRKRMLKIAALLKKASSEIVVANQLLLEDLGITHTLKPDSASLDGFAGLLSRLANSAYRKLASGRISGRDQHLVFLSRYVEKVTGAPHHREIADLVNAMRERVDPKSNKTETDENIRKRVRDHSPNLNVELELARTNRRRKSIPK